MRSCSTKGRGENGLVLTNSYLTWLIFLTKARRILGGSFSLFWRIHGCPRFFSSKPLGWGEWLSFRTSMSHSVMLLMVECDLKGNIIDFVPIVAFHLTHLGKERTRPPFQLVASSSVVDLSSSRPAVTRMSRQRLSIPNEPMDSSTIRPDLLNCILIIRPRATLPY